MDKRDKPTKNEGRSVQYGKLAEAGGENLELQVLKSAAGYYLGTRDDVGDPVSRESEEYYRTEEQAKKALKESIWTQRGGVADGNDREFAVFLETKKLSADRVNAGREERHRIAAKLQRDREAKNEQSAQRERPAQSAPGVKVTGVAPPEEQRTAQNARKPRGRR
jgi:hypothetical protein